MRTHLIENYQVLRDSPPCLSRAATLPKAAKLEPGKGAHLKTTSSANHTAAASQPTGRIAKAASWLHLSRVSPALHPPESRMPGGFARRHDGAPLWRETLGRSLESHNATELVGGMCHGNGCRQETTRLHAISCTKTGWSSLTHNRVLHQALAQFLRESKVQLVVEDTWRLRQRASEQNGRLNPLRMDITTEAGALFDNYPRLKNKALLLLDITIVNPCAGSNLGNAARHIGKHLADAVERKKNKYWGSFPATYAFLPLVMSTYGDVGSDVHVLIKELAIRGVLHRPETYSNESQHLAEGTEVARLRRRFSFVLQQALSFRTRHHLCR